MLCYGNAQGMITPALYLWKRQKELSALQPAHNEADTEATAVLINNHVGLPQPYLGIQSHPSPGKRNLKQLLISHIKRHTDSPLGGPLHSPRLFPAAGQLCLHCQAPVRQCQLVWPIPLSPQTMWLWTNGHVHMHYVSNRCVL